MSPGGLRARRALAAGTGPTASAPKNGTGRVRPARVPGTAQAGGRVGAVRLARGGGASAWCDIITRMTDGITWLAEPQGIAFGDYSVTPARGLGAEALAARSPGILERLAK